LNHCSVYAVLMVWSAVHVLAVSVVALVVTFVGIAVNEGATDNDVTTPILYVNVPIPVPELGVTLI